ncbi:MAG: hypothetical protein NC405_01745 [Odoribacter sp.]|nr:hypothetical protein [Odoribacter sp.]
MTTEDLKRLNEDPDGLISYEYIANNIDSIDNDLHHLVDNIMKVDLTGQFTASTARYLHAIDPIKYAEAVHSLVAATIEKDREHRYLPDVLSGIYGTDYEKNHEALAATDDNFRRIYKRLFPNPESL